MLDINQKDRLDLFHLVVLIPVSPFFPFSPFSPILNEWSTRRKIYGK